MVEILQQSSNKLSPALTREADSLARQAENGFTGKVNQELRDLQKELTPEAYSALLKGITDANQAHLNASADKPFKNADAKSLSPEQQSGVTSILPKLELIDTNGDGVKDAISNRVEDAKIFSRPDGRPAFDGSRNQGYGRGNFQGYGTGNRQEENNRSDDNRGGFERSDRYNGYSPFPPTREERQESERRRREEHFRRQRLPMA